MMLRSAALNLTVQSYGSDIAQRCRVRSGSPEGPDGLPVVWWR